MAGPWRGVGRAGAESRLRLRNPFEQALEFVDATVRHRRGGTPTTQHGLYANVARELCRFAGDIRVSKMTAPLAVQWRDELESHAELSVAASTGRKASPKKGAQDPMIHELLG